MIQLLAALSLLMCGAIVMAVADHGSNDALKAPGPDRPPVKAAPEPATATCDKVAATNGSDSAAGTVSQPYRSVQKLVDSVSAAQTACLRAGTHHGDRPYGDAHEEITITRAGITLTSFPGERPTLVGRLRIDIGADGVRVIGLNLDGTNTHRNASPTVNAKDAVFSRNDVTNNNTGICFGIGNDYGAATGTILRGNRIHNCGQYPRTNHEHGIYVSDATDTRIHDNLIYDNADRGVQLYPDADRTVVRGNIIDGNGEGVVISGAGDASSDRNLVMNNIISNSEDSYNVYSSYTGAVPSGNVVRENCVWPTNPDPSYNENGGILKTPAFTATKNVVVDPDYFDRGNADFRTGLSTNCLRMAPSHGAEVSLLRALADLVG